VLAYVFWHRAAPLIEPAAYEAALVRFHAALAAEPPPGWHGSAAHRIPEEVSWVPGRGPAYEDWYLVADWAALGALNDAAVAGARQPPHDAVAAEALAGAGGVFRLIAGDGPAAAAHAAWTGKPAGADRDAFAAALEAPGASVWMRELVLGPAPEYAVRGPEPLAPPVPAAQVALTPLT
jgi:hypothetical protein